MPTPAGDGEPTDPDPTPEPSDLANVVSGEREVP
jgi:hypothetical protein